MFHNGARPSSSTPAGARQPVACRTAAVAISGRDDYAGMFVGPIVRPAVVPSSAPELEQLQAALVTIGV